MLAPIDQQVGDFSFAVPLRAIDHLSVRGCDTTLTLLATKTVEPDDPYMAAHFPGFTIFPGVFILEGLRQGVITALGKRNKQLPEIRTVRSLHFSAPLLAGDQMTLEAVIEKGSGEHTFEVKASCRRRDGVTAAQLKVEFAYA